MTIRERILVLEEIETIISGLNSTLSFWEEQGYYEDDDICHTATAKKTVIKELEKLAKGI